MIMEALKQSSLAKYIRAIRELPRGIFNWHLFLTVITFALSGSPKGQFYHLCIASWCANLHRLLQDGMKVLLRLLRNSNRSKMIIISMGPMTKQPFRILFHSSILERVWERSSRFFSTTGLAE
jgi:hypothetical protein